MPLLPYRRFVLTSPKSAAEAEAVLRDLVRPRDVAPSGFRDPPFEGEVGHGTFACLVASVPRQSAPTRVRGTISACAAGSRIAVTVGLRPLDALAMVFCVAGIATMCMAALVGGRTSRSPWLVLPMALVGVLFPASMAFTFSRDVKKTERLLTDALDGCLAPHAAERRPRLE